MGLEPNRDALRRATLQSHRETERAWIGARGFGSQVTYEAWLGRLLAVHCSLGQSSAQALELPEEREAERERLAALCRDLGIRTPQQTLDNAPSLDWAWGVRYALNGSALGAAVLLKSRQVPQRWPHSYLTALRAYAQSGGLAAFFRALGHQRLDLEAAQAGAEGVFLALRPKRVATDTLRKKPEVKFSVT